jgi:hypothetical protein
LQDQQVADVTDQVGNSVVLEQRFRDQRNSRSKNVVNELDNNFDSAGQSGQRIAGEVQGFNYKWFSQNRLNNDEAEKTAENNRVQSLAKKKAPMSGKPDSQLKESFGRLNVESKRESGQMSADADPDNSQRRGELAQQIEQYQRQLDSIDSLSRQARPSTASAVPGANENQPAVPQAAGVAGLSTMNGVVDERIQAPGQNQQSGGMGGGGGGFGGGGLGGFGDRSATPPVDSVQMQAVVTGLTSLDVDIPQRGREYFFTTPRGDIEVTATPIKSSQINRAAGLLTILAVLLVAWIVWHAVCLVLTRLQGKPLATLLVLFGGVSLCTGFFAVLGILAMVSGIWIFVRTFRTTPAQAQAVA